MRSPLLVCLLVLVRRFNHSGREGAVSDLLRRNTEIYLSAQNRTHHCSMGTIITQSFWRKNRTGDLNNDVNVSFWFHQFEAALNHA